MEGFNWDKCFGCQLSDQTDTPYCVGCKLSANEFWQSVVSKVYNNSDISINHGVEICIKAKELASCTETYNEILKQAGVVIGGNFEFVNNGHTFDMKIKKDVNYEIKCIDEEYVLKDRLVLRMVN